MASPVIHRFSQMLGLMNRGRLEEKIDAELQKALETLEATPQQKGKAKITLEITLDYDGGNISLSPRVRSKLPDEPDLPATNLWVVDGALSVQHPSQTDMFIRDAGADRKAV